MSGHSDSISFSFEADSAKRLHAIAPVLIGLLAPVLVLMLVDARALGSASVLLHVYLGAIFVIATIAYVISVFDPGEVTRVDFLARDRVVEVERTGLVAKKSVTIPFADIATLRIEARYDDDGYRRNVPLIVLTTHETVELPETVTEADVAAMRRLIGRG